MEENHKYLNYSIISGCIDNSCISRLDVNIKKYKKISCNKLLSR